MRGNLISPHILLFWKRGIFDLNIKFRFCKTKKSDLVSFQYFDMAEGDENSVYMLNNLPVTINVVVIVFIKLYLRIVTIGNLFYST